MSKGFWSGFDEGVRAAMPSCSLSGAGFGAGVFCVVVTLAAIAIVVITLPFYLSGALK